jgi:hypothetical protein
MAGANDLGRRKPIAIFIVLRESRRRLQTVGFRAYSTRIFGADGVKQAVIRVVYYPIISLASKQFGNLDHTLVLRPADIEVLRSTL